MAWFESKITNLTSHHSSNCSICYCIDMRAVRLFFSIGWDEIFTVQRHCFKWVHCNQNRSCFCLEKKKKAEINPNWHQKVSNLYYTSTVLLKFDYFFGKVQDSISDIGKNPYGQVTFTFFICYWPNKLVTPVLLWPGIRYSHVRYW